MSEPESDPYRPTHEEEIGFPAGRTALLVIDPVNDFLSEGGAAWDLTRNTVEKNDVVGTLRRVIEGARRRGVPVLFGPMAFTEEDYARAGLQRRSGIARIMYERKMFLAGTWGADFHPELQPAEGDVVLLPHKGSDVFETDLPEHLERLGTTHLVICGMAANLCCEGTGRHATEHGYDVTFLSDAIGAENLPAYEASIHINYPLIGNAVLEVDEFLAAVGTSSAGERPQKGDSILGSDRGRIGTVEEIVDATEDTAAHLVVKGGHIFGRHLHVPLDAVVKRAGDTIFVNVPKLVVGKMPWDDPPSAQQIRAQTGPPAGEVEKLYRSEQPSIREE